MLKLKSLTHKVNFSLVIVKNRQLTEKKFKSVLVKHTETAMAGGQLLIAIVNIICSADMIQLIWSLHINKFAC